MRLGVMSDTHGNIGLMQRVCDLMLGQFRVEAVVHLGDDYADAIQMDTRGKPLYAVPGMYESAWEDGSIAHRLIKTFGGVNFMMSHTPTRDKHDKTGDINPGRALEKYGAQVLLHGHSHRFSATTAVDGLVVICPGHIKAESDRGLAATFAVIDVAERQVTVKVIGLDGTEIEDMTFKVPRVPHPAKGTIQKFSREESSVD